MTTAPITNTMPLEDMSGPIAYWGPAWTAQPAVVLSPAELSALRRLRDRLVGLEPGASMLSSTLDALLTPGGTLQGAAA